MPTQFDIGKKSLEKHKKKSLVSGCTASLFGWRVEGSPKGDYLETMKPFGITKNF
jgi:hypothetical protein